MNMSDAMRKALADLLAHIDRETCTHDETHRGGAIWTICDGCGMKWADDQGGFQPHEDAPAVAAARALLASPGGATLLPNVLDGSLYLYRHRSLPGYDGSRVWLPWQRFGEGMQICLAPETEVPRG